MSNEPSPTSPAWKVHRNHSVDTTVLDHDDPEKAHLASHVGGQDQEHDQYIDVPPSATHTESPLKPTQDGLNSEEAQPPPKPAAAPPASGLAAPDGGLQAWLVALGCFFAFLASFGFVVSFGVFQAYYEVLLEGRYSSDDIAWIGSLQLAGLYGLGIPGAIINDRLGPQLTIAIGGAFVVLGVMTASAATEYWQIFLSHGVCCTIGYGLIYIPAVVLPQQWFDKKRALVIGLCVGGSSVGGVLFSIVFNQMVNFDGISFGWAMRTIAFIQLALLSAAAALVKGRMPRNLGIGFKNFPFAKALSDPKFALFCFASLVGFLGVYVPYFFLPQYAISIGASKQAAFYMSSVLNASTFFGRFMIGRFADSFGAWNTVVIISFICGLLNFAWSAIDTNAGLWVWAIFYGFFSGAIASIQGPCNLVLCPQPKAKLLGAWIAIGSVFSAIGCLGGEPIGGRLIRSNGGDFKPAMYFAGGTLFASAFLFLACRLWISRGAKL